MTTMLSLLLLALLFAAFGVLRAPDRCAHNCGSCTHECRASKENHDV
jgi:hypothetical protein